MSEKLSAVSVNSTRMDHAIDIIKKKLSQYTDHTIPTYEYYE